jgi:hypothetical protein
LPLMVERRIDEQTSAADRFPAEPTVRDRLT